MKFALVYHKKNCKTDFNWLLNVAHIVAKIQICKYCCDNKAEVALFFFVTPTPSNSATLEFL